MTIFGKTLSDYIGFGKTLLILVIVVGVVRFVVSVAGLEEGITGLFSMTALNLFAVLYYPYRVHTRGFGGAKHVWVLLVIQVTTSELVSAGGIGFAALTGVANTYSPVGPDAGYLVHALFHLLGGPTVFALVLWGLASLVLLVVRKTVPTAA